MTSCALDPTGFNPGLGPQSFNSGYTPPPPPPPLPSFIPDATSPANVFAQMKSGALISSTPSSSSSNVSPADVFASMKSGTFASGMEAAGPQPSGKWLFRMISGCNLNYILDKYDALRPSRKFCYIHLSILANLSQPSQYNPLGGVIKE